jgi:hypothetical protein
VNNKGKMENEEIKENRFKKESITKKRGGYFNFEVK